MKKIPTEGKRKNFLYPFWEAFIAKVYDSLKDISCNLLCMLLQCIPSTIICGIYVMLYNKHKNMQNYMWKYCVCSWRLWVAYKPPIYASTNIIWIELHSVRNVIKIWTIKNKTCFPSGFLISHFYRHFYEFLSDLGRSKTSIFVSSARRRNEIKFVNVIFSMEIWQNNSCKNEIRSLIRFILFYLYVALSAIVINIFSVSSE